MPLPITDPIDNWSRIAPEEVLRKFGTTNQGLQQDEVNQRLQQYGNNILFIGKKRSELWNLLQHFKNPLVIILLFASIISFYFGQNVDALIIIAMVVFSITIDYFQERDARNAAEKLKDTVKNKVAVLRNGKEMDIPSAFICPGDIVILNAGKIVPSDCRVLESKDFFVNQSSLTGESFPCEKYSDTIVDATNDLTSMDNMVFMGSSVMTGYGKAIVVKTGSHTEFGKIAAHLVQKEEQTDFSKGVSSFGFLIMRVSIVLVLFIFLVNALLKHDILESFMFSLAVAVGLTPELLPMVMSVTMAKGSQRMVKRGVVVKRLTAIPNFGSMDVLCTDKTGTLTEDHIQLVKYVNVKGASDEDLFLMTYLNSYFQTGIQNPLDQAVIQFRKIEINDWSKIDEVPFDFSRKRMSVVVERRGVQHLICKGAPEEIIKVCVSSENELNIANQLYESLSVEGFRVLAVATKVLEKKNKYDKSDESSLILRGFAAFLDPPKQDADETIKAIESFLL